MFKRVWPRWCEMDHFQQILVMQVQEEYLLNNFETVEPKVYSSYN